MSSMILPFQGRGGVWRQGTQPINEHTTWHLTDFLIKPYKLRFFTLFATRNRRILLLAHLAPKDIPHPHCSQFQSHSHPLSGIPFHSTKPPISGSEMPALSLIGYLAAGSSRVNSSRSTKICIGAELMNFLPLCLSARLPGLAAYIIIGPQVQVQAGYVWLLLSLLCASAWLPNYSCAVSIVSPL